MSLVKLKGKIRGVSGNLNRKGFDAGHEMVIGQVNSRIRKIFNEAKTKLPSTEYRSIFEFSKVAIPPHYIYEALNPSKLSTTNSGQPSVIK